MVNLRLVIISGLSGSGKTHAIKCFEDLGFFCVDNLPPLLLPTFIELCTQSSSEIRKVAVGIDIRERDFLKGFLSVLDQMDEKKIQYDLIFMEAKDEIIIRRFSETRRPHPLRESRTVPEGIQLEKRQLAEVRTKADRVIDTSDYTIHQLKETLTRFYIESDDKRRPTISLISFGYKYGIPHECDYLFDVRFLQNPHFVFDLKDLSGQDSRVEEYIFKRPEANALIEKLEALFSLVIPFYEKEGRAYLTIGIGCTGGRHRSVAILERLQHDLEAAQHDVVVKHRDIDRDP